MPLARLPMLSMRWARRNRASSCFRSVTSSFTAMKWVISPAGSRTAEIEAVSQKSEPSLRRLWNSPRHSRPARTVAHSSAYSRDDVSPDFNTRGVFPLTSAAA
jgi:hypothetical protein